MKKFKKLAALALSGAMALSLAIPAFAADTAIKDETTMTKGLATAITGTTEGVTLNITVPGAGNFIVNPYKKTIDAATKLSITVANNEEGTTTEQIISTTQYLINNSDVPVQAYVSAVGKVAGKATLLDEGTDRDDESKWLELSFQWREVSDEEYQLGETSLGGWGRSVRINSTAPDEATDLGRMAAYDADADVGSYIAYGVTGEANSSPSSLWAETDTASVTATFTFEVLAAN